MTPIERKARELYADAHRQEGSPPLVVSEILSGKHDTFADRSAIRALITALTPPAGGLPELPAGFAVVVSQSLEIECSEVHPPRVSGEKLYTADQLHAYALEAIAASRVGWLPIESAPKDRTAILIAGGTYSVRDSYDIEFVGPCVAYWDRDHWHGNELNAHDEWCYHEPTHWQPLPAAPQVALNRGGEEGK